MNCKSASLKYLNLSLWHQSHEIKYYIFQQILVLKKKKKVHFKPKVNSRTLEIREQAWTPLHLPKGNKVNSLPAEPELHQRLKSASSPT